MVGVGGGGSRSGVGGSQICVGHFLLRSKSIFSSAVCKCLWVTLCQKTGTWSPGTLACVCLVNEVRTSLCRSNKINQMNLYCS